ncbi:hypothetical protein [Alkaliphilus sp. B6464]|uniref:hypothetical protein n=1 Tax=Alkaliphilus sp. B6464 TaxID=2731219 RepID=UPI001BA6414D|nr:hypothetical protein [Alkaliphilus sp. B6464]QUH18817.1 hypothetical protein HYG84_02080 [Alkaliphilus sp. B6464]
MKRILSTALLLTLSSSLIATPVFANEANQNVKSTNVLYANQEMDLHVLEGTIKDIREFDLVVEDSEGKEYVVPILGFKNLEEYQTANVEVGQKILLKGIDLSESKPGILVKAIHADDIIHFDTNDLEIVETDEFRDKVIPNFKITKQLDTEAATAIDEADLDDMKTKSSGAVRIKSKSDFDENKVQELRNIGILEKGKNISSEDQVQFGKAVMIDSEGTEGMAVKVTPFSDNMFIPQEITINEVTIKLPMMTKSIETAKTIN